MSTLTAGTVVGNATVVAAGPVADVVTDDAVVDAAAAPTLVVVIGTVVTVVGTLGAVTAVVVTDTVVTEALVTGGVVIAALDTGGVVIGDVPTGSGRLVVVTVGGVKPDGNVVTVGVVTVGIVVPGVVVGTATPLTGLPPVLAKKAEGAPSRGASPVGNDDVVGMANPVWMAGSIDDEMSVSPESGDRARTLAKGSREKRSGYGGMIASSEPGWGDNFRCCACPFHSARAVASTNTNDATMQARNELTPFAEPNRAGHDSGNCAFMLAGSIGTSGRYRGWEARDMVRTSYFDNGPFFMAD